MKISYAITVKDELVEIQQLVSFLLEKKQPQDEIVVLFDDKNGSKQVEEYLRSHSINDDFFWFFEEFDGHFANWKNKLNMLCSGDFIFNIDADEIPYDTLIENIHYVIESNPTVDLFLVSRVNIVDGITQEHVNKWHWAITDKGWINWPDMQMRIYKNTPEIKWENKVHEKIVGAKAYSFLPVQEEWSLKHIKTIGRQERQNEYYNTLNNE